MANFRLISVTAIGLLGGAAVGFKVAYDMRVTAKVSTVFLHCVTFLEERYLLLFPHHLFIVSDVNDHDVNVYVNDT